MMQQTAHSGEKAPLFGGRKPLFTQSQLLKLTWPLLVEQFLAVTVDGSALRYTSVYRVREHFLNMKISLNPTRREG